MLTLIGLSKSVSVFSGVSSISLLGKCLSTASARLSEIEYNLVKENVEIEPAVIERGPLPIITGRHLPFAPPRRLVRQAWVDNLDTIEEKKLGLVDLHPDIFGAFPRIDILHANIKWQRNYRYINWAHPPNRMERRGGGRKPWPQKGLGKARHGSIRSPIWYHGGKAHGPRGPETHFYMLPFYQRIMGLTTTLSMKFAQDDLKIVDTLEIPTDDPSYLKELARERHWGVSVLYVDDTDLMPKNITLATDPVGHHNLMPVYGLNCFSMLKHETLVLTLAAVNKIEDKLLYWKNANDSVTPAKKYTGQHSQGME
jgi:large subunit ribosomal protein L4